MITNLGYNNIYQFMKITKLKYNIYDNCLSKLIKIIMIAKMNILSIMIFKIYFNLEYKN